MNIRKLLPAALCALTFTACDDSENEIHSTYFYPLTANGIVVYADQPEDSTFVVSYDSWTLNSSCEWMTVSCNGVLDNISVNIPEGYYASHKLTLTFQPNTTGATRGHVLQAVSSSDKIGSVYQTVTQYPFLDIRIPSATTVTDEEGNVTGYTFTTQISQTGVNLNGTKQSIAFCVYHEGATLESSDTSWLNLSQTSGFETGVQQRVELNATTNETGSPRTATLTLTSGGVSTPITVTQAAE